jgi:hypothetical protein
VVAAFLMAAGVGLFGTMSGLVASWFMSPSVKETDSELAELRNTLKACNKTSDPKPDPLQAR